jgi:prepilin-type N-terminal cleavage/methylation domain-containing protein
MKHKCDPTTAFTLVELLVVIAIIAVLAALLLPALNDVKAKAQRTACTNNLRHLNTGIRMYSDDSHDASPSPGVPSSPNDFLNLYSGYKALMKNYVGLNGASSVQDKVFACPADRFYPNWVVETNPAPPWRYVPRPLHNEPFLDFTSYVFNGGNNATQTNKSGTHIIPRPGLTGIRLSAVKHPSRTALISEGSAPCPWSWHEPSRELKFNDAKNVVSFVDGHVSYLKIYLDGKFNDGNSEAYMYDPPATYNYQWSPN